MEGDVDRGVRLLWRLPEEYLGVWLVFGTVGNGRNTLYTYVREDSWPAHIDEIWEMS